MFKTLHDILKTDFQITDTELEDAWKLKEEKGGELGEILVQRKVLSEQQLLEALSRLFDAIPTFSTASSNERQHRTENEKTG